MFCYEKDKINRILSCVRALSFARIVSKLFRLFFVGSSLPYYSYYTYLSALSEFAFVSVNLCYWFGKVGFSFRDFILYLIIFFIVMRIV